MATSPSAPKKSANLDRESRSSASASATVRRHSSNAFSFAPSARPDGSQISVPNTVNPAPMATATACAIRAFTVSRSAACASSAAAVPVFVAAIPSTSPRVAPTVARNESAAGPVHPDSDVVDAPRAIVPASSAARASSRSHPAVARKLAGSPWTAVSNGIRTPP
ncbi:hypothetical protein ADK67_24310 [Saccharothrix sp. NRRL B-16348]|nr:hypothetical protein ADK67_24310 [Saccharothrix sp. NRRL B-16348]